MNAESPEPLAAVAQSPAPPATMFSPFLPLLLSGAALLVFFLLQTWQLTRDHDALTQAYAAQQTTVDNATKLRRSLESIASDTKKLSDAGNPGARLLVDELRKQGVTINN